MTSVYAPIGSEGYELCQPVIPAEFMSINSLISGDLQRAEKLPTMKIIKNDEGIKLMHSDAPWLGSQALIFRESVVDSMRDLLKSTNLIQFHCDLDTLYLCNPPIAINALNEDKSLFDRFSDGRIMQIKEYVFMPDALDGLDIFKIDNVRVSSTFVSQRFVDTWQSLGLQGLEFKLVWTDCHAKQAA